MIYPPFHVITALFCVKKERANSIDQINLLNLALCIATVSFSAEPMKLCHTSINANYRPIIVALGKAYMHIVSTGNYKHNTQFAAFPQFKWDFG